MSNNSNIKRTVERANQAEISKMISEAGRRLFAVSREKKKNPNDADRLRKYLAKFALSFERVKDH